VRGRHQAAAAVGEPPVLGAKIDHDGIWIVSFMRDDLGYFDLEQRTQQPVDNPFGPRLSPIS
jgi:hypothetical protein